MTRRSTDEDRVNHEFLAAEDTARKRGAGQQLLEELQIIWKMFTDKEYSIDPGVKAWLLFALVYFVIPLDAIPDVVPGVGYLDDAAVVAWVIHQISDELRQYRRWRTRS